ncbi:glycan-binding surface protein [Confluentibacter citreus]|uniref:glycan-binding surface protein n=1 Tax=Confluentibacter citreus TaxID=2007307 RepID=UPI0012FD7436|nr:glycan-binding surface protein [Confluentibacter citreus]
MKNILNKYIPFLLAFSMTVIITLFTSCDKNDDDVTSSGAPVITEIRNYAASPNDTLVDKIVPGQWIVIHGKNLKEAKQITINGSIASFEHGLFSNETAVIQVPWSVPFYNVDPALLHTINYATKGGTTSFKFDVIPPAATITGNSMSSATMAGDSIYIYGTDLYLIERLTLAGTDVSSFTTVDNGSSIGFILPAIDAPMPWAGELVLASGIYEFDVLIVPEIFAVSNANPDQGDLIRIYGKNLNGVSSLSFGGANITDFTEDPEGSYVEFLAPDKWSYSSGPVTTISEYGTATTVYDINTQNDRWLGLLANFEWGDYFGYHWWGDISLAFGPVADFNGSMGTNNSMYIYFNTPILAGGESKYAPLGNANNTSINNRNAWIPVANLSDPVENWGLQFEISVANPWNGGTLYFKTEFAGESYVARYEPWKISASKTLAFETEGWQTVTIPLSQFKSKKVTLGDGDSVTSLNLLLGPTGESSYDATLKNFASSSTATGFYAAIDNIRVVKIKE